MDRITKHVMGLVSSDAYRAAAGTADALGRKVALSNRFQVDAACGEADSFFSALRLEKPEIYQILAIREKEIRENALRIKTGRGLTLD